MAASKYLNDDGETEALVNSDWADIGKLPRSKIDDLETQFLSAIVGSMHVYAIYHVLDNRILNDICYRECIAYLTVLCMYVRI